MQGKKPLNIAIGRRIQQSREQAGLTQEELAERIDRSTPVSYTHLTLPTTNFV